jgi:hypothetical protein
MKWREHTSSSAHGVSVLDFIGECERFFQKSNDLASLFCRIAYQASPTLK